MASAFHAVSGGTKLCHNLPMRWSSSILSIALAVTGCADFGALAPTEVRFEGTEPGGSKPHQGGDPGFEEPPPPEPLPCSDGDEHFSAPDGSCYFGFRQPSAWAAARQVCQEHDSHLASVASALEHDWIWGLGSLLAHSPPDVWLGGNDVAHESEWVWADADEPWDFTAWEISQPDMLGTVVEDCLVLHTAGGANEWYARNCLLQYRFLCERNL